METGVVCKHETMMQLDLLYRIMKNIMCRYYQTNLGSNEDHLESVELVVRLYLESKGLISEGYYIESRGDEPGLCYLFLQNTYCAGKDHYSIHNK